MTSAAIRSRWSRSWRSMIWTYWRVEPTAANCPSRSTTSAGVPAMAPRLQFVHVAADRVGALLHLGVVLADHTVWAVDRASVLGSRPIASQAAWTRLKRVSVSSTERKPALNSSA